MRNVRCPPHSRATTHCVGRVQVQVRGRQVRQQPEAPIFCAHYDILRRKPETGCHIPSWYRNRGVTHWKCNLLSPLPLPLPPPPLLLLSSHLSQPPLSASLSQYVSISLKLCLFLNLSVPLSPGSILLRPFLGAEVSGVTPQVEVEVSSFPFSKIIPLWSYCPALSSIVREAKALLWEWSVDWTLFTWEWGKLSHAPPDRNTDTMMHH